MDWPNGKGSDALPSLASGAKAAEGAMARNFVNRNSGLAPINANAHFSKSEDQAPMPRSSHGVRQEKSNGGSGSGSQWANGGLHHGAGGGGQLHIGKLPQPLGAHDQGPPPTMPSSGSQTARQLRSSGGPRGDQVVQTRGSLSARPSSKGSWAQKGGLNDPQTEARQLAAAAAAAAAEAKEKEKEKEREKEKEKEKAQNQLPMTPAKVLKNHMEDLTDYEQGEILDFPQIWYFGAGAQKIRGTSAAGNNHGYDDERGDYNIVLKDHILYRYEVMSPLGKGSFGQVVRTFDYKSYSYNGLKVIRNKKRFHHQALVEVKILEHIRERDVESTSNVVHMMDYFYFRNHLCITFELLSINLYEFIKNNNFQGVSLGLIRRFAIQLLAALRFLKKQHIIHCDLKPENVLLKNPTKSGIKVIDFGSSCFEDERVYTYIQSRFYRSPEVILGIPYDVAIDMWSFGCILAELYTGYPLFPGENEVEQLACIMEIQGLPTQRILESATRIKMFFDTSGAPRLVPNSRGKTRRPGSKELHMVLRTSEAKYVDFLQGCLQWNPRERFPPEDALQQEWILEGYARHATQKPEPSRNGETHSNHALASPPGTSSSSSKKRFGNRGSLSGPASGVGPNGGATAAMSSSHASGFGGGGGGSLHASSSNHNPNAHAASATVGGGSSFVFPPIDSSSSGGAVPPGGLPPSSKPHKSSRSLRGAGQQESSSSNMVGGLGPPVGGAAGPGIGGGGLSSGLGSLGGMNFGSLPFAPGGAGLGLGSAGLSSFSSGGAGGLGSGAPLGGGAGASASQQEN